MEEHLGCLCPCCDCYAPVLVACVARIMGHHGKLYLIISPVSIHFFELSMSFLQVNTSRYLIPSFCGPHSVKVFPLLKSTKGKFHILAASVLSGASF